MIEKLKKNDLFDNYETRNKINEIIDSINSHEERYVRDLKDIFKHINSQEKPPRILTKIQFISLYIFFCLTQNIPIPKAPRNKINNLVGKRKK